jgi:hypothetical protein
MAAIIADLIVLTITWHKVVKAVRETHLLGKKVPIGQLLLRDG